MLEFFVKGIPLPMQRPKVVISKGRAWAYTDEKFTQWKNTIKIEVIKQLRQLYPKFTPSDDAIYLDMIFYFKPLKSDKKIIKKLMS